MKNTNVVRSTLLEKILFAGGTIGSGSFIWTYLAGFITLYYTNNVGIAAGAVGTMILICRIFDGVTDVIMGTIVERTRTRFGKARIWMLIAGPLMAVTLIMCFNMPKSLSAGGQIAWMYISYILIAAVAYTICGVSTEVLMARMSTDPKDINTISTVRMISALISATMVYSLATTMLNNSGGMIGNQAGWSKVTLIFAIIGGVTVFLMFFIREKVTTDMDTDGNVEKVSFKVGMSAAVKHREFFILIIVFLLYYMSNGLSGSGVMYYTGYVLGDFNVINMIQTGSMVVQVIAMLCAPFLLRKLNKITVLRTSFLLCGVLRLLAVISPSAFPLYVASTWGYQAFMSFVAVIMFTLIVDLITYIACKTSIRAEGFVAIASNVGTKIGTGLGAALVGWLLQWGQFDGMSMVQGQSAQTAIVVMVVVIPGILFIIGGVVMFGWKIHKELPKLAEQTIQDQK